MKCVTVLLLYVTEVTCIEHSEAVMLSYCAFISVKLADEIRNGEGKIKHSKRLFLVESERHD